MVELCYYVIKVDLKPIRVFFFESSKHTLSAVNDFICYLVVEQTSTNCQWFVIQNCQLCSHGILIRIPKYQCSRVNIDSS